MPDQKLELEVTLEDGQFKVTSKNVTDTVKKTGDGIETAGKKGKKGFGKLIDGVEKFKKSAKAFAALAVVATIFKLVKASLASAAAMEKQKIALSTMLKSGAKADKLLKKITDFAASTPFQLPGLIDASKRLLAFGVEAENIIPTLRNLGNAAGGNAEVLDRLTLAYGKLKAKGKASLEEINMFTEAGVPLMQALADKFEVTTGEMFKMISTGKVGFDDVKVAIDNLTTGTGKFAGMLEKQSQSLSGLVSTLKDKIGILALELGQKLSPAMKDLVGAFLDGTDSGGVFTDMLTIVSWILKKTINSITVFVRGISLLTTSIERGLIKVKKIKFEISQGVSEEIILQNRANDKYKEYIALVDREAELRHESQGRLNSFISSTEELFGLTEKIKETEEKVADIREKRAKKKSTPGGGGKGGKDKGPTEFEKKQARLLKFHQLQFTLEDQQLQNDRARQNQAAADYQQFLQTKFMMDSVYFAGLQTVAATAAVFMAEKNKKLFRFGQGLAIAQTWISTFQGMLKAYAQLGPIAGSVGAGVILAAGALNTRKIAAQKPPAFAVGSVNIPRTTPAVVHQGEMIINKPIAEGIRGGDLTVGGPGSGAGQRPMVFQIDGRTFFEVNEQHRDEAAQNLGSDGSFPVDSPY